MRGVTQVLRKGGLICGGQIWGGGGGDRQRNAVALFCYSIWVFVNHSDTLVTE